MLTTRRSRSTALIYFLLGCAGGQVALAPAATPPPAWPVSTGAVPRDAALEARIHTLLAALTLEQKVAQMVQPEPPDCSNTAARHRTCWLTTSTSLAHPRTAP